MKNCEFCKRPIDDHYDYEVDSQGNVIGDGYTPCQEMVIGGIVAGEYLRRLHGED